PRWDTSRIKPNDCVKRLRVPLSDKPFICAIKFSPHGARTPTARPAGSSSEAGMPEDQKPVGSVWCPVSQPDRGRAGSVGGAAGCPPGTPSNAAYTASLSIERDRIGRCGKVTLCELRHINGLLVSLSLSPCLPPKKDMEGSCESR